MLNVCVKQSGESLIEVLVALLVFSIGLAGLATLQVSSLKRNLETTQLGQASRTLDALSAEIRLNIAGFDGATLHSDQAATLTQCGIEQNCSPRQRAESAFRDAAQASQYLLAPMQIVVCRDRTPEDGGPTAPACDGGNLLVTKLWWVMDTDPNDPVKRLTRTVPIP